MKLEIKHLAPYLPYGLKAEMLDYQRDYVGKKNDTIVGIHQWDKSGKLWSLLTEGGSKPSFDKIKPILRPLSNLQKGFHKDFDEVLFDENNYVFTDELGIRATPSIELFIGDGCNNTIIFDSVIEIYNLLLKHHFDIFRLIQKGLAIDINTFKSK